MNEYTMKAQADLLKSIQNVYGDDYKIDPEFKVKWIDALRSGNYAQGKFALRDRYDKFCCLGVACEVAELKKDIFEGNDLYVYSFPESRDNGMPYVSGGGVPPDFKGIKGGVATALMSMNDSRHMTFAEIADFIEENL